MSEGEWLLSDLDKLLSGAISFDELRDAVRDFQFRTNPVMAAFEAALGFRPAYVPVRFFKDHRMRCDGAIPALTFRSSGTTGQIPAVHEVHDPEIYQKVSRHTFVSHYGNQPRVILALLPHYLERGDSSLVCMVHDFISAYGLPGSGFYLHNLEELYRAIIEHGNAGEPIILIGVAYALLDFAAQYPGAMPAGTIVIETGGMKGRKQEITRTVLHATLRQAWQLEAIHSEYGMTELLSQAYAARDGRFVPAVTMRVEVMDPYEPGKMLPPGSRGRLCITDLANIWSCAFIMTDDLGKVYADGSFEVTGRLDTAEIRGCSLMYAG